MSHYTVAVIVPKEVEVNSIEKYINNVMEPFSEYLEVDAYIGCTVEEMKERYTSYCDRMKKQGKQDEIESFEEYSKDYCGCGNDEEGNALSTYNPNSKWDWYKIGGRWNGIIETKDFKRVNYARIKDIVFTKELNDLELQKAKKEYKKLIKEGDIYIPEYYQKRYPTLESYLKTYDFSTYALLDTNGKWHEPGKMGHFGLSTSSPEEKKDFDESYMDLINSQDENSWLVVVDCHI